MPDDKKPAAKKKAPAKKKKPDVKPDVSEGVSDESLGDEEVVEETQEEVLATDEAEEEVVASTPSDEVETVEEVLPDENSPDVGADTYEAKLISQGRVVTVERKKGEPIARKAKPLRDRRH